MEFNQPAINSSHSSLVYILELAEDTQQVRGWDYCASHIQPAAGILTCLSALIITIDVIRPSIYYGYLSNPVKNSTVFVCMLWNRSLVGVVARIAQKCMEDTYLYRVAWCCYFVAQAGCLEFYSMLHYCHPRFAIFFCSIDVMQLWRKQSG